VLRIGHAVPADYIRWIEPDDTNILGYVVGGEIAVMINCGDVPCNSAAITLPQGEWMLVAAGDQAGTTPLTAFPQSTLPAGTHTISLAPYDVKIWIRK
jgi:hypothetical protein